MKVFTDFFGFLDGRLAFIICAVVVAAVFIFSLIIMVTKRGYLPLGRITAIAALASGLACYFMTLCTADAAYAAGNAVMIIAGGSFLGLVSAVVSTFTRLPSREDTGVRTNVADPAPANEKPASAEESKEALPLEKMMYEKEEESPAPVPAATIELPLAAAPETGFEEVLAKAEKAVRSGIGLTEAKALITQISKLKLLPENAPDVRRRALAVAQQKIVNAVRK